MYPTSFLVDCLLTDAFGTAVLGNVTSQKFPRLPQLDLGLRSTTGALRFDRGLDMDLPSPYPTERDVSFSDFTYANPNAPTENKPELPEFLGGQYNLKRLYQGFNEADITSDDKVRRTANLINQIRTGGASLNRLIFDGRGSRFNLLSSAEKSSAILDPVLREILLSRLIRDRNPITFTSDPLSGLKGFELFNQIQEGLLGEFVSIRDDTTTPYSLANRSGSSARSALQTQDGDLVMEASSISRKEKPLLARSITETIMWASLKAMKGGENQQNLLELQSDMQSAYDAVSEFHQLLSENFTSTAGNNIVETRIKPCMQAMFAWSETPPTNIADTAAQSFAEWNRIYKTPTTTFDSLILIDGTELLPGGRNFGADLANSTERYKIFDLVMQEMFDRAYIIDGGDSTYKEALQLIIRYKIMHSIFVNSRGEGYAYGGDGNSEAAKIVNAFKDRFESTYGRLENFGSKQEPALTFNFAFLAVIKEIVNSGTNRNSAEDEINESIGLNPLFTSNEATTIKIDFTGRRSSDYTVEIDEIQYDLLAPFGSLQSFRSSVKNNPAVLAAYISLCTPPIFPRSQTGTGLNVADMVARWIDKFLELNSDCFDTSDGGNANFTRNFPYSLEYIIGLATRVAIEGILASDISFWGGYNRYTLVLPSGDTNLPKLKEWKSLSTLSFNGLYEGGMINRINTYIDRVSENLIASLDIARNLTSKIANLKSRLRLIKDRVDDIVEAVEQADKFPYLRALSNSSTANDFPRLLLSSMTSGYSTAQFLCNSGFSTQTAEGLVGELPMTMLKDGILQKDALSLSVLLAASGLVSTASETTKRSRSRVRTLCVGIPNGFMSTAGSSDFFIPILNNQDARRQSQTQEQTYDGIAYRSIRLDIKRRDLRFAANDNRRGANISTPTSIDWPIDLRVVSAVANPGLPGLQNFNGRLQASYRGLVSDTDSYFIRTALQNLTFTIGKFDLYTGEVLQLFEIGSNTDLNTLPAAIRNLVTSYCLGIFYVETVGVNFDETVMVSDKRFFSAAIPTAAVPTVKAEALRLHGISENEIESVLERVSTEELGVSRRLIKFQAVQNSDLNLNPRQQLVLSYVMSAANKLQVADGFLRSISPKAFDQVAYIPIDIMTGGYDLAESLPYRRRSSVSNTEKFQYQLNEDNPIINRFGGGLFNPLSSSTALRSLTKDESLNETLPCEFWVELAEEEI